MVPDFYRFHLLDQKSTDRNGKQVASENGCPAARLPCLQVLGAPVVEVHTETCVHLNKMMLGRRLTNTT